VEVMVADRIRIANAVKRLNQQAGILLGQFNTPIRNRLKNLSKAFFWLRLFRQTS